MDPLILQELKAPWSPNPEDQAFADKFEIEMSFDRTPLYRHLYRACFQGPLKLHKRKSDLTQTPLLSMYGPDKPYPVYSVDEWWSGGWDPQDYGMEYDFSRSLFDQLDELYRKTPKMSVYNKGTENCEYTVGAANSKNCYYSYRSYRSENIYYSENATSYSDHLCDCLRCFDSSWLYDCVYCKSCHQSVGLYNCENTRDSAFSVDLVGCHDCMFCHNLRHKSYHFFNEPLSKEAFEAKKKAYWNGERSAWEKAHQEYEKVFARAFYAGTKQSNCEDCLGDGLNNCADCHECFDCIRLSHSRYCWDLSPSTQASHYLDVTGGGIGEFMFNSCSNGGENYFLRMCFKCRGSSYITYCIDCYNCDNCFACSGLNNKKYCILNRQYSKEEYEELLERIINQAKEQGVWGQFLPLSMSPFAFNESLAARVLPLSKSQAQDIGLLWNDKDEEQYAKKEGPKVPPDINEVGDEVLKETFLCAETSKPYRLVKEELSLYKNLQIPLPLQCPDSRMAQRRRLLRPRFLWERTCARTGENILSSLPPAWEGQVFSEKAYMEALY